MEEIVVNPHTGRWWTVGTYGAEFVDVPKNAIVFNHKQSKALLENGNIFSRGKALAGGNAMAWGDTNLTSPYKSSKSSKSSSSSNSSSSSKSDSSSKDREKFDWIEISISRVERAINNLKNTVSNSFEKFSKRTSKNNATIKKTNKEIDLQYRALDRYKKEANSVNLSDYLKKKVRNGAIDIREYGEDTQKRINEYKQWYEKVLECDDSIKELTSSLSELYQESFDITQTKYENKLERKDHKDNQIQSKIDKQEAQGKFVSRKYYKSRISNEEKRQKILSEELVALQKKLNEGVKSGAIKKYSEAWYEMQSAINSTSESLEESKIKAIEAANEIRQISWDKFDFNREQTSLVAEESDFLIDQIAEHQLYDDNGKMNKYGRATGGLHAINYNVDIQEAKKYATAINKIDKQIAENPTDKTLIERRNALVKSRQDSLAAAKQEKEAMIDLVKNGYDKELEALSKRISKYKENLRSSRELYEYQKKLKDQNKNITDLQKQIAAYEGDDSEEARAKVQKLKADLANAQEDLKDTEEEKRISDQEELLDKMYEDYEEFINNKLENVTSVVNELINSTNENSSEINKTITSVVGDIGYGFATELGNILNNQWGKNLVSGKASDTTATKLGLNGDTPQKSTGSKNNQGSNGGKSSGGGKTDNGGKSSSGNNGGNNGQGNTPTTPQVPAKTTSGKKLKVGDKINAKGAMIYATPGAKGRKQYFSSDPVYIIESIKGGYYGVRYHKAKSGLSGWFKKKDVKAYKHGGLVDETGLAWLDGTPSKPEAVLNAEDSANLISLTDTLRKMASTQGVSLMQDYSMYRGLADNYASILWHKEDYSSAVRENPININENNSFVFNGGINIPIDHVENYEDFVTKLRDDGKFEKMIQAMTIGQLRSKSALEKKKYKWN